MNGLVSQIIGNVVSLLYIAGPVLMLGGLLYYLHQESRG